MTYSSPELLLVGAAQTLVLGQCYAIDSDFTDVTCDLPDDAPPPEKVSRTAELW